MAALEKYSLIDLEQLIKNGKKFRLFKPFMYNGQVLINIEKILTEKDVVRLEGKVFGPIEVVPSVAHNTDNKLRTAIVENCIKILKTSPLFHLNETHHLDFHKRKEVEKIMDAIIKGNPHLAKKILELYQLSKPLFIHTINVSIIALVIDLGLQQKRKIHNALRSEELITGALLHDIGFLNFPASMVNKKRRDYDKNEKKLYRHYPIDGKKIAGELGDHIRSKTLTIIEQHQERLPGHGFPHELKGNEIDELALVVGLADEFDLILSKQIALHNKSASEVMSRISRSGKFFGHDIVDSFYTWFRYLK